MTASNVTTAFLTGSLGLIFTLSAWPKLRDTRKFHLAVLEYKMLPDKLGRAYAWVALRLELLCGVLFLTGAALRVAALLMSLLMVSFLIGVVTNLIRGRVIDCHCFGTTKRRLIGWRVVLEDVALLVAASALFPLTRGWTSLQPWSVFQVFPPGEAGNFIPLIVCLVAALSVPLLLGRFGRRKEWRVNESKKRVSLGRWVKMEKGRSL